MPKTRYEMNLGLYFCDKLISYLDKNKKPTNIMELYDIAKYITKKLSYDFKRDLKNKYFCPEKDKNNIQGKEKDGLFVFFFRVDLCEILILTEISKRISENIVTIPSFKEEIRVEVFQMLLIWKNLLFYSISELLKNDYSLKTSEFFYVDSESLSLEYNFDINLFNFVKNMGRQNIEKSDVGIKNESSVERCKASSGMENQDSLRTLTQKNPNIQSLNLNLNC